MPSAYFTAWILFTAVLAAISFTRSLLLNSSSVTSSLYRHSSPAEPITPLATRLFGVWHGLTTAVRLSGYFDPENATVLHLVFATYVLALVHLGAEFVYYRTAGGVVFWLMAGTGVVSVAWMIGEGVA